MFVTISGHKKKDRVFGIKCTGARDDKNQSKVKKQGVRNETCPEDRNEHRQLIFRDKTLKFDGSSE